MNPTHLALKALKRKRLIGSNSGVGTPAGALIGDADDPNGSINGQYVGQIYFSVSGGVISSIWVFNGTPGTDSGWIGTM